MKDINFADIETKEKSNLKKVAEKEEVSKNQKAFTYMAIVAGTIFLIFFIIKLPAAKLETQIKEENLIEIEIEDPINLGNDANGALGDIQPLIKGDFAPPDATPESNPKPSAETEEPTPPPLTNDNNTDAVEVPKAKKNPPVSINKPPRTTTTTSRPTPNTAPPRPRASMGTPRPGGTDNGNGATTDRFGTQGNGRGNGDQGNPFGTPNGTGQRLSNANLKNSGEITRLTEQSGTNFKGKVTLVLRVDDDGNVTGINSNSPAPSSKEAKTFASSIAYKMKFPAGADGRTATIVLDFDY
jgi:outer membrane biosynthesis protein TonB